MYLLYFVLGLVAAWVLLRKLKVATESLAPTSNSSENYTAEIQKNEDQFRWFTLMRSEKLTHNSKRLRFALPEGETLELPLGSHLQVKMEINGVIKKSSYTPIASSKEQNYFDLVIKTYEGGKTSVALFNLQEGEKVQFRGPTGRPLNYRPHKANCGGPPQRIGMIAGGTGLTPMLQVMKAIADDTEDLTEVSLLFANRSMDDILLRDELDQFARLPSKTFRIHHILSREQSDEWKGLKGYISAEVIQQYLPPPVEGTRILICGPVQFCKAVRGHLKSLNYKDDQIFKF